MFGVAVGHINTDEIQQRRKRQNLLHLDKVGIGSAGRDHHMLQHIFRHTRDELLPLLNAVMFMHRSQHIKGRQRFGHGKGAHGIHIGSNDRHT